MEITERDWKIFRKKVANWQECYMERLVVEYITFLQSEKPASSKFWELEKRIKQDKKCPGVLIQMRRSTAINNIIRGLSIYDNEEYANQSKRHNRSDEVYHRTDKKKEARF